MLGFPLLLIPLAVCNIIVFLMPGVSFAAPLFTLPLLSGTGWTVTLSDALVSLGLFLLLLEVVKSARPGGKYVTDHLLALLIFGGAAAEFVMLPQFANATFFLLTLIALVDFLSGLGLRGRRPRRVREAVVAETSPEPVMIREPGLRDMPLHDPPATPLPASAEPHSVPEAAVVTQIEPLAPPRVEPIIDLHPTPVPADAAPRPPGSQS